MTVTTSVNKVTETGDAIQVDFPHSFIVLEESHMNVYLDGVLEDTANWSWVSAVDPQDGGTVTMATAPGVGVKVTLLRIVPNTQLVDYSAYGSFPAETHERALDLRVMEAQQIKEEVGRSIRFSVDTLATFDATFPSPIAGRAWKITADGLGVEHTDVDIDDAIAESAASAAAALVSETASAGSAAAALVSENNAAASEAAALVSEDAAELSAIAATEGSVNVTLYGAVGDGVTDDTAAIQAAIDSLGVGGGTILLPKKHVVDSNLTVNAGITLKGVRGYVGMPADNISYDDMDGTIILNSLATIILEDGSSISGLLVYRKGLLFPENDSSAFAGIAVTNAGMDTAIFNSMFLGFGKLFYSNNFQRFRADNVLFDCLNGFDIEASWDIARISNCHGWPFACINGTNPANWWKRSGIAFRMAAVGDWTKIEGCFCYGYVRGFVIDSCNSCTLISCGADSVPGSSTGLIGYEITGTSLDTRLESCQAASSEISYYINTAAGNANFLIGCSSWSAGVHGVLVAAGDVIINSGLIKDTVNGINVANAASRVFIDNIRTSAIAGYVVSPSVLTSNIFIGENNDYGDLPAGSNAVYSGAGASLTTQVVASADPILLPPSGKVFHVSGVTNTGNVNAGWAGREVTLIFDDTLTVFDGGANMRLAGNFVTSAGDTLTLVHDGVIWNEVSRSVN